MKKLILLIVVSFSTMAFAQSGPLSLCCVNGSSVTFPGTNFNQGYCSGLTPTKGGTLDFGGRCQAIGGVCAVSCDRDGGIKEPVTKVQCRDGSQPAFIINSAFQASECEKNHMSLESSNNQKICCKSRGKK